MNALTCAKWQPADRTEVTKAKNINSFKTRFRSTPETKGCEGTLSVDTDAGVEEWSNAGGATPNCSSPQPERQPTRPPDCSSMSPQAAR